MKKLHNSIAALALLMVIGTVQGDSRMTSTERAKLAYESHHVDSALIERRKMLTVLRTMRTWTKSTDTIDIFERACKLNLNDTLGQRIFDSLVERVFLKIDLLKNPDTPENEFREEILRRIDFCDRYFGKWWEDYDLRAAVVIQLGINGISYSPPVESFCIKNHKQRNSQLCEDCGISYPDRNIYIQLQRKYGDECFDRVIISNEIEQPKSTQRSIMIQGLYEATSFFKTEITNRLEPPSYNPFPESEKDITAQWRLFRRQTGPDEYEVWSIVAMPMEQFTPDSARNYSFSIRQVIRNLDSPDLEIFSDDSIHNVTIPCGEKTKTGNFLTAVKSVMKAGKWKYVITPVEGKNKTIYYADIEIPGETRRTGLSDILLYVNQKNGYQVQIGNEYFTAIPFTAYKREHTLNALVSTYGFPESDSLLVTWYLRPVESKNRYQKAKSNKKYSDSPTWIRWHGQEFPVLKFLNRNDLVLDHIRIPNLPIYKLSCPLSEIPTGEYDLNCLIVDSQLSGITRESTLRIKIN